MPFRTGVPDIAAFPLSPWDRFARRLRTHPYRFAYEDIAGLQRLRSVLADHLRQFRALRASADQIVIVEGPQSALVLIAQALVDPGDPAVLEDPGCPFAIAFEARGRASCRSRSTSTGSTRRRRRRRARAS
ncbi:hypothetical protein WPS_26860 [Vulcanimicrobium alpinum]|uniref:Aminotransferase class I/classII domain-containing protein n=1 Tax=Vulcanimicrobium alpinum TaxID=3016050 RepID=A0AAN2CA90_UNVUL|nr:hypothetical protein [Vulcanimicrobium alpinum]BDE07410.1 hypothetical protein WPS_26860 [Vulcanimicrobium alpinum]